MRLGQVVLQNSVGVPLARLHDLPFERQEVSRNEALLLFRSMGEDYKLELLEAIPEDEIISLYRHGDFVDLCRGPHVERTGQIKTYGRDNVFVATEVVGESLLEAYHAAEKWVSDRVALDAAEKEEGQESQDEVEEVEESTQGD